MKKPVGNKSDIENLMEMQLAEAAKAPGEMDADFVLECAEAALELQNIRCELSDEEIAARVAAIPFKNTEAENPKTRRKTVNVRRVLAIAAALAGTLVIMCVMAIAYGETSTLAELIAVNPFEKYEYILEVPIRSREELEEKLAEYAYRVTAEEYEIYNKTKQEDFFDRQFAENGGVYVVFDPAITYTPSYAKFYDSLEEAVKGENLDIIYPTEFPGEIKLKKLTAQSNGVEISWFNPYNTANDYSMYVEYSNNIDTDFKNRTTIIEIGGIDCYEETAEEYDVFTTIAFEYNGDCYYISGQKREVVESLVENMLEQ